MEDSFFFPLLGTTKRPTIVPFHRNDVGEIEPIMPQIAVDLLRAVMLPGEVYKGKVPLRDPQTGNISDEVIKRSADLAGAMTLGSGAIPADKNSLRMGIKAYHGSPHDFDKFDLSKIGTGEGAQAYGHGLYFADSEGVARSYRDALAQTISVDDAPILKNNKRLGTTGNSRIDDILIAHNGDLDAAIAAEKAHVAAMGGKKSRRGDVLAELEKLKDRVRSENTGRMYEVNIDADPADFLDWDKPLSEQPSAVRDAMAGFPDEMLGGDAVKAYSRFVGERAKADNDILQHFPGAWAKNAADELNKGGIPGIKYLDAGSRDGSGNSRNYVVFDDKLISIVKKYGIGALVLAGVISQEQGDALAAEGYPQIVE